MEKWHKKIWTMFCDKFVGHVPKMRQTEHEKTLKKVRKICHRMVNARALQLYQYKYKLYHKQN